MKRIEKAWTETLSAFPRESQKRRQSDSSFGGILKRQCVSVERETDDAEKIKDLLSEWDTISNKEQLLTLVRLFKRLDPILTSCKKKLQSIQSGRQAGVGSETVSLESVIAYGRRISSHVRAPPEYSDPTGNDGFCVPGYFFPCPDYLTMGRSALFHSDKIRAVPPTITFKKDSRTRALYWIDIQTPSPNPTIRFAINSISSWSLYVPNQRPYVAGVGHYTVRAYCQAEGFFLSEVTVATLDVQPSSVESETRLEPACMSDVASVTQTMGQVTEKLGQVPIQLTASSNLRPAQQNVVPTAALSTKTTPQSTTGLKFGGLFLSGASSNPSSDEDSDDNDE